LFERTMADFRQPTIDEEDIDKLVEMIGESEKPMVILGGGVVRGRAHKEFNEFVNLIDAPTAITVMGGGGMYGRNPNVTGMIGMHGSQASNIACDECDLLIAVGCRFSDRVALDPESFAKQAKIVHIDIDRSEINKNVQTDHHIVGNAKDVLKMLNERLTQQEHSEWKKFVFSHPTETVYDDGGDTLNPKQVCDTIARLLPDDTMVATDVGQHQMWAIQHFHFTYPGQLITSGGFGTMGFGLGAAIGAKVGNPDKMVIHVAGDGSFRMNCNELCTVQDYKIPIISFIFNNGTLGMVRQWQNLIYKKNFSETTLDRGPDFVKLAEAYGLHGRRVNNQKDLEEAIKEAMECGEGFVIDCVLDIDEMVRPMVGGGDHITNFMKI
ncbi:MAG: acetolactate synthase large subunit, partial [Clostridiales bacterium]|nr:acetolactate synthase large subunit [Clostridiales bacterium]